MSTTETTTSTEASDAEASDGTNHTEPDAQERSVAKQRSVAIPLSTIIIGSVAVIAIIAALALGGFLISARSDISDYNRQAADDRHAEQIATSYAVGAATIRFDDLGGWIGRLKAGTSPQLSNKFDATAPKLQDILTPLKWTSTASPITAKVSSSGSGIYQVDVFVNVSSTNAQNPDGAQTTVTYNVTIDQNSNWEITDVGGVNAALPTK